MSKTKTQNEFEQEVYEAFGDEYTVLGQYINNKTKILIRHNKCGNEFDKNPKDMITKHSGCPYCNGNKSKLYNEDWVKSNTPFPYKYVSGYSAMRKKCIFYCEKCNSEFEQEPSRLITSHIYGCNCCPTKKKTNEEFLEEISDALFEYEILDKYTTIDTPISFIHKPCRANFKLTPYKFIYRYNKKYCPICYYNKSHGEVLITSYLVKNNFIFNREYTFKELPNRKFDFYLPEYNICIEFDGKQHFESIEFFGGEESFLATQKRDASKNKFCLDNNIILFRIPYTDLDRIEQILNKILKEKSSETIEKYRVR